MVSFIWPSNLRNSAVLGRNKTLPCPDWLWTWVFFGWDSGLEALDVALLTNWKNDMKSSSTAFWTFGLLLRPGIKILDLATAIKFVMKSWPLGTIFFFFKCSMIWQKPLSIATLRPKSGSCSIFWKNCSLI